jgi:hypothetical protein
MRVAGGAFLVAVAMIFFYLITTGKLAAAWATFHVLANPGTTTSANPTAGVTPTPQAATPTLSNALTPGGGTNPYGANSWTTPMSVPALPTLPTLMPAQAPVSV